MEKTFCPHCLKSMYKTNIQRHKTCCRLNPNASHGCVCDKCGKTFSRSDSLKSHRIACEKSSQPSGKGKFKCHIENCDSKFHLRTLVIQHLKNEHEGETLKPTVMKKFDNYDMFLEWKEMEEHNTFSYFSKQNGGTKNINYFYCQHDGTDKIHGHYTRLTDRTVRRGRIKTGKSCIALMKLNFLLNNSVLLTYYPTHSHPLNPCDVIHHPISAKARKFIEKEIETNKSPAEIAQNVISMANEIEESSGKVHKDSMITQKRIRDKVRSYNKMLKSYQTSVHRFPNKKKYPKHFKAWAELAIRVLKLGKHVDYDYFNTKRVCNLHFPEKDKKRNNRISANAFPSLNLPDAGIPVKRKKSRERDTKSPDVGLLIPLSVIPENSISSNFSLHRESLALTENDPDDDEDDIINDDDDDEEELGEVNEEPIEQDGVFDVDDMFGNVKKEKFSKRALPAKETYTKEFARWLAEVKSMSKSCQTDNNFIDTGCNYKRKEVFNVVNNVLQYHNYTKVNTDNICRLCAKIGCKKMVDLSLNQNMIKQKITVLYPSLNLKQNKSFPRKICFDCCVHIENAFEFYECALQCEKQLKLFLELEESEGNKEDSVYVEIQEDNALITEDFDKDKLSVQFIIDRTKNEFHCPFCDEKFVRKRNVVNHLKSCHFNKKSKVEEEKPPSTLKECLEDEGHTLILVADDFEGEPSTLLDSTASMWSEVEMKRENFDDDMIEIEEHMVEDEKPNVSLDSSAVVEEETVYKKQELVDCYRCCHCSMIFSSPNYVNAHSASAHKMTMSYIPKIKCPAHQCESCSALFSSFKTLGIHKSTCKKVQQGIYTCLCSEMFDNFHDFYYHLSRSDCVNLDRKKPRCKPNFLCPFCHQKATDLCNHVKILHRTKIDVKVFQDEDMDAFSDELEEGEM